MSARIIRFCYRKIIDSASQKTWDRFVFDSSYAEFLMQSQLYNKEKMYSSFSEIAMNVPGADKLHFLVSASVTGYIQQLNEQVPDITDNLGKLFLRFKGYRFEIINSDVNDKSKHRVAINFFTEPMIWYDTIDKYLLVSSQGTNASADGILTHLVELQPFFSIYSLKEEKQ